MDRKEKIIAKITENLQPEKLIVKNNSSLHSGHLGDDGTGQTHFYVEIDSLKLKDLSRIQAHKKINEILADEFEDGLHALEIKIVK